MNLIVFKNGSQKVHEYVENAVVNGTDIIGTNAKIQGLNRKTFSHKWTEDVLTYSSETGWDKTVDQVTAATEPGPEFTNPDRMALTRAMEHLNWFSNRTYQQIEDHVTATVTDMAAAREYLVYLSKIVLALTKTTKKHL